MKRFFCFLLLTALLVITGQRSSLQAQPTAADTIKVTLTGNNFTRQSVVFVGTTQFTPEYVSPNTLDIKIPRSILSSVQPNNVRVVNPSAGGGSSSALPIVAVCRANNAVFAEVTIVTRSYTFQQLDSVRYSTPPYSNAPLSQEQQRELAILYSMHKKTTSVSGKVFNDGNVELRAENTSIPAEHQTDYDIRYSIMKTATDSIEYYNKAGEIVMKAPVGNKPMKLILDKVQPIRDSVRARNQAQVQVVPAQSQTQSVGSGTTDSTSITIPMPNDSLIARNGTLYDAWRLGFTPTRIGSSPRYRVLLNHNVDVTNDLLATVRLAANEEMELIVNTETDVVEEIRTYRGTTTPKPLVHRTIQRYSYTPENLVKWKSVISYSFYELNELPMVLVNVDIFDEFSIVTAY